MPLVGSPSSKGRTHTHTRTSSCFGDGANENQSSLFLLSPCRERQTKRPPKGASETTMATKKNQQPAVCHGHSRPIVDLTYRCVWEESDVVVAAAAAGAQKAVAAAVPRALPAGTPRREEVALFMQWAAHTPFRG